MKVIKTVLDPQYEVFSTHYSSEYDDPIYYTKDGMRIPYIEVMEDYKPSYDSETANLKHWYYRTKTEVYRDVHTKIATLHNRNGFTRIVKQILVVKFDKHIGRFITP